MGLNTRARNYRLDSEPLLVTRGYDLQACQVWWVLL